MIARNIDSGAGPSQVATTHRRFMVRVGLMAFSVVVFGTSIAVTGLRLTRQVLPTNVDSSAAASSGGSADAPTTTEFNNWFKSGTPTLNGVVNPANSVTFTNNPNGDFYKWAWQMFLWVNSPAPPTYGGGAHIFDSSTFFDVSAVTNGARTLLAHPSARFVRGGVHPIFPLKPFVPKLALKAASFGVHGLPVIVSKTHKLLELVPQPLITKFKLPALRRITRPTMALSRTRQPVASARIKVVNKKVQFFDEKGAQIIGARPFFPTNFRTSRFVTALHLPNSGIIFVDPFNNVIDVDLGQAETNATVMSQGNSLVYYRSMVNDVYAYFLTGMKDGGIASVPFGSAGGNEITVGANKFFIFPTTQTQLNQVTAFAAHHSVTFADPTALCIEIKSSWVDASTLSNPSSYIQSTATVPTYNTSNPTSWVATGQKTITLALVGMHIVGSTAGHPELVWATFEHFGNTPNAAYSYLNSSGHNVNQPADSVTGPWLFCSPSSTGTFNVVHMTNNSLVNATITAESGFTISPSDTQRLAPFGSTSVQPNPFDPSAAASNSEILTANNVVRGLIPSGDIRANYFLVGSTWTENGESPAGNFPSGNCVGTSQLSDSTMETYFGPSNCFDCHGSDTPTTPTVGVSHLFGALKKLF